MHKSEFEDVCIGEIHFAIRKVNFYDGCVPLVFLHGYMTHSMTWDLVVSELPAVTPMLFIDLPGSGQSARIRKAAIVSADKFANRLIDLLRNLGIVRCHIIGSQMGGSLLGYMLAEHHRLGFDIIDKGVIMAAGALGETNTNMHFYKLLRSRLTGAILRFIMPQNRFTKMWRAAHGRGYKPNTQRENSFYDHFRMRGTEMTQLALAIRTSYGKDYSDLYDRLRPVKNNVLLIWGQDDKIVPEPTGKRFQTALSNSKLVILDKVGDFPQEESPTEVARCIISFINEGVMAEATR